MELIEFSLKLVLIRSCMTDQYLKICNLVKIKSIQLTTIHIFFYNFYASTMGEEKVS